ncbi:hypothetical protein GCM10011351_14390 [Paraliobacillus quinghaiensis]|uniref:SHOCT domain-containing protein n=1 Tax=Paraliobacillus quinghaiensis TaxID=470815 RepID=A0A917WUL7_9BACI|nr:hypothetical protein [Paraliobacillus quinghaiensis]GGM29390.1 hypothetical protein GCM10011351_14390 [Paraliobacillus quinghaiensis]
MFLLLIVLAIGFYLYKTGELQKWFGNNQTEVNNTNGLKEVIDYRYASGQISIEEYNKLKALL